MQPVMKPLASYKPAGKRENVKTAVGDTIPTYCVEPDGFSGKSDAAILVVHDMYVLWCERCKRFGKDVM